MGTVGRPVAEYAARSVAESIKDYDDLDPVGLMLVGLFKDGGPALADADFAIRKALFDLYAANTDFESAASTLSSCIAVPAPLEARTYADVAQAFIFADDLGHAEATIRKVKDMDGESKTTQLRVRACRAQIADLQRSYHQAASRYASLAQEEGEVEQDELKLFLDRAATCAILDRAGPQRQQLLNKIYRDTRSAELPSFVMLEKMCKQRLIRTAEAEAFRSTLRPHHLASVAGGGTVFDRAVREHNVLAASLVYSSVSFASLGDLLGLAAEEAERVAARMVEEGRLEATIDQMAGILEFGAGRSDELAAWDSSLMGLFGSVMAAVDAIGGTHAHLVPE